MNGLLHILRSELITEVRVAIYFQCRVEFGLLGIKGVIGRVITDRSKLKE